MEVLLALALAWALFALLQAFSRPGDSTTAIPWPAWESWRRTRAQARLQRALAPQMPTLLEAWSAALRSGLGLAQALDAAREELEEPAAGLLRGVADAVKLGQAPELALQAVAESLPAGALAADWRLLASGVAVQRSQGGNLAEILDQLTETLRERQRLQEQIAALTAQGRLSAWVVGLLPPFLLIAITALDPQLTRPLFVTSTGWVLLALACLLEAVGVIFLKKLAEVEV